MSAPMFSQYLWSSRHYLVTAPADKVMVAHMVNPLVAVLAATHVRFRNEAHLLEDAQSAIYGGDVHERDTTL